MAATLKMVADAANVSVRTAGRALSGSGPVKPEVAERVLAAARQLQYVPNAAARSLKQRDSRIVGLISGASLQNECIQRRILLFEAALREAKYHTLLGRLTATHEELDELLRSWAGIVESVVFLAWNPSWDLESLKQLPLRFLFIDCELASPAFERIETDRASGVAAAVSELVRCGRRRIVRVGSDSAVGRRAGFERAIAAAGDLVTGGFIPAESLEYAGGYAAGDAILASDADAVFFDTDRMALGFYRYASERGVAIPARIAVAGFDDDAAGAFSIPALTTVAHPDAETVALTVSKILSAPAETPELVRFPSRLIRRESI